MAGYFELVDAFDGGYRFALFDGDGDLVVSYTCRRCGCRYSHYGPEGWVSPGWEWYD